MATALLSDTVAEDRLQLLGIDTENEQASEHKIVRLIDETRMKKDKEQMLLQAFTFGTKLGK